MKRTVLPIVEAIAGVLVFPLVVLHRVGAMSFRTGGEVLSTVPGLAGVMLRRAWYRRTLAACGEGLSVALGALIHEQRTRVGNHCHFGAYTWVGLADIGDDVLVASHSELLSGAAHYGTERGRPMRLQYKGPERIVIGEDVWVGAGALVAADVAAHSIVAAGAVVVRPDKVEYSILGGIPARRIGQR